jgi:hypothetical protein
MRLLVFFALALPAAAQGLIRGVILGRDGDNTKGTLAVQEADKRVWICHYDAKAYFEPGPATAYQPGDLIEVIGDKVPDQYSLQVRTVHRIEKPRAARRVVSATEALVPRGNLTFAGAVVRVSEDELTLRGAGGAARTLRLRPDTRFFASGLRVERTDLAVNTRVFVRGGRDLDGEVEVFQVMWGEITPGR